MAIMIFIAYATLSPIQEWPTIGSSSVFEHLAALFAILIVRTSGALLELLRNFRPSRHGAPRQPRSALRVSCHITQFLSYDAIYEQIRNMLKFLKVRVFSENRFISRGVSLSCQARATAVYQDFV
jgi:hypothetical protein